MGVRILVVDDAPFIRDMVKKQLRDRIPGLELNEAADGARALALIKQWQPEIVLSDWEMPVMTGEELLREIRGNTDLASLPFIMITSRGDRDHVVKAVQLGVSDYITKPFTPEELLRKVGKQLKAIGKMPAAAPAKAASGQGVAFGSLDVLTAGRAEVVAPKTVASGTAALLQTNPLLTKKDAPALTPVKVQAKGKAQLRFPNNLNCACIIREMSLQLMSCSMERMDQLPTVFDQVVVDIETGDSQNLARVNGYVHAIQAAENRPDTLAMKIIIRFVDNDPTKFETLSKYIAQNY